MTVRFALPDVGEGLHEAEVVRWLVAEGDAVARDQPLVEVLTDKAQVELPSPVAGTVARVAVAEGDVVEVGTVLIEIDDGAGPAEAAPAEAAPAPARSPARTLTGGDGDGDGHVRRDAARPKASPSTRKLAVRHGVDLRRVSGTGPGGRILASDVEAAATAAPGAAPIGSSVSAPAGAGADERAAVGGRPAPAPRVDADLGRHPVGTHPLRGIRRLTAAAMARSWSTIPHITGMDEVDATDLLAARRRLQATLRARGDEAAAAALTPLVLLAAAVAQTLRRFPLVNAAVTDDGASVTVYERVNLGIAVATPDGLIVPVVADADQRDVVSLALEVQRLAAAARDRTVGPQELRGGTFTLTNYGALGGRTATPIILPGQAGIMGFGSIRDRPIVHDGAVVARPTLPVVFSADHRIIDGDLAVAFQEAVMERIADPVTLLLGA